MSLFYYLKIKMDLWLNFVPVVLIRPRQNVVQVIRRFLT